MQEIQQASLCQSKIDKEEKLDRKKSLRDIFNLILPDSLMITLAVIMIPLVLIPIFVNLSDALTTSFQFVDYVILGIFIIEYFAKTILAPNIFKHIINPWHLLDLLVIVLPFISLLPAVSTRLGLSSPLLRLLRIVRILAIGSRAVDRKLQMAALDSKNEDKIAPPLQIKIMDGKLENTLQDVELSKLQEYLHNPTNTWIDISLVSENDFDLLSTILGIPRILLESELVDESYPRVDYFEHYSMIFARVADIKILPKGPSRLLINRTGLLVICHGKNIITLSRGQTGIFNQILEKTKKFHSQQDPVSVSILYTLLKYILEKDKQIIAALEQELMAMENIPPKNRPSNFLETTFHLRKEVNQLVPSLLHLKEIITVITSKRVPLEGFSESHEKIFDILMDEATYLHETASNARDNLLSLIDLYINTTSYEMNRVMRYIAVITVLGIVPAMLGLLGSNIIGNPWNIHLWQVFGSLGIAMVALIWIFYRLGWLKG
jgi:Mg2+ and Co2+ transporter CorA